MRDRCHLVEFDSPAGRWRFASLQPTAELAPSVELIWEVEGYTTHARDRILPSAAVEILINLGAPHRLLDRDRPAEGERFDTIWVSGMQRQYLLTETTGKVHILGVRFAPGGARTSLGIALNDLADRVVPLDQVLAAEATSLRERVMHLPTVERRCAEVEDFLLRRIRSATSLRPEADWLARQIARQGGALRLESLYAQVGRSPRHVIARFHEDIGVAPKTFARILRFRRVIEHLKVRQDVNWSRLAQAAGYYDHAHFDHDFRAFAGASPSEFLLRRSPDGDSMIVD